MRGAHDFVEALISQKDSIIDRASFQATTSTFTGHTSNFEDIDEIRVKLEIQSNVHGHEPETGDAETFIESALPEKFRTKNVDGTFGDDNKAVFDDVGIGKIDAKKRVVLRDVGTQQERTLTPQLK